MFDFFFIYVELCYILRLNFKFFYSILYILGGTKKKTVFCPKVHVTVLLISINQHLHHLLC